MGDCVRLICLVGLNHDNTPQQQGKAGTSVAQPKESPGGCATECTGHSTLLNPSQLERCYPLYPQSCVGSDAVGNQHRCLHLSSHKANLRQFLKLDQEKVQKRSGCIDKIQSAAASLHQSKRARSSCNYWLQVFKPDY